MVRKWLTSAADNRCEEHLEQKTSSYLVGLMIVAFMFSRYWAFRMRVLAKVVAVVGVLLTVNDASRGKCGVPMTALSVVCHLIPYAVYLFRTEADIQYSSSLWASCVLLPVLAVYMASNTWPYTLNPLTVGACAIAIMLTSLD